MKPNSFHDASSDPDAALDQFFRVREMTPDDFASRTIEAARAKARRTRAIHFTAWTSGLAASFALLLGLNLWRPAGEPQALASTPPAPTETAVPGEEYFVADELVLALQEATWKEEMAFYAQALALETLLAETVALTEEDSRDTLDFLFLLAQN